MIVSRSTPVADLPELLRVTEAAAWLGVSPFLVRAMIENSIYLVYAWDRVADEEHLFAVYAEREHADKCRDALNAEVEPGGQTARVVPVMLRFEFSPEDA